MSSSLQKGIALPPFFFLPLPHPQEMISEITLNQILSLCWPKLLSYYFELNLYLYMCVCVWVFVWVCVSWKNKCMCMSTRKVRVVTSSSKLFGPFFLSDNQLDRVVASQQQYNDSCHSVVGHRGKAVDVCVENDAARLRSTYASLRRWWRLAGRRLTMATAHDGAY